MVARAFERDNLFSLIAGPLVWVAHFLVIYITTAIACAHGFFDDEILGIRSVLLVGLVVTVVAVALIVDAAWISWRRWHGRPWSGPPEALPPHDGADVASRRRFMAYAGLLLCGISLIATVWQTLPILFYATCR